MFVAIEWEYQLIESNAQVKGNETMSHKSNEGMKYIINRTKEPTLLSLFANFALDNGSNSVVVDGCFSLAPLPSKLWSLISIESI